MSSVDVYPLINNLNNATVYLHEYLLVTIYILGNLGNLFSFLLFMKKSWKKNVCVFYFKFCLLFNTCYLNCATLGFILINGFQINFQNYNSFLCKGYFYFSFVFATISPTILILASIDRLLISSQNIETRLYSSKRLAYFSLSICIIFWSLINIHLLVKVNIQQSYLISNNCYYDSSGEYQNLIIFSNTTIHVIFFLLMISLCLLSFKNIRQIQSFPSRQQRGTRSMTKKDFQLLRCLFVQDLIFILFGILLVAYYLYLIITKNQSRSLLRTRIEIFLSKLFNLLYAVPFAVDFFVFILVSKAFRHECQRIIFGRKKQNEIRPQQNEENVVT